MARHLSPVPPLRKVDEREIRKDGAMAALEELKRRIHATYGGNLERCNHINEALAQVYWLQHQIKIGELEL
jgi:hypothetical protein